MATIICPENPSPVADAEAIRKATKGWGTDEKSIIGILGRRNAVQRQLIRKAYSDLYGEDLVKVLESELTGDFERAVYRWILDPLDRDAVLLHVALKKKPVDYRVIVEMSCVTVPEEFLGIKRAYQARYKHSLEEDVASHTEGDLRRLLVGLVSIYRYHSEDKDARLADKEVGYLCNAVKEKVFNNDEVVRIVTTRSKAQVVATVNRYKDEQGISITKHLKGDPSDGYLVALQCAIQCTVNPHKYYERMIRRAVSKVGTDEEVLTRVIVTRAERDLQQIKELYYQRNSVTLEKTVAKETSGDYKAFLLTLLGNQN